MALTTNGWDYCYFVNLVKLNALIANKISTDGKTDDETKIVIVPTAITSSTSSVKIEDLKGITYVVKPQSNFPKLFVEVTIASGKVNNKTVTNIGIQLEIDINWINRNQKSAEAPTIPTNQDTEIKVTKPTYTSTGLTSTDKANLENTISNFFNEKYPISLPVGDRKYKKHYDIFASINEFGITTDWMKPSEQVFSILKNQRLKDTDPLLHIFSFSCMIEKTDEKGSKISVNNYNPGYVDLNAIPKDTTSALVIERSVFAEHMVKPVFTAATTDLFFDKVYSDKDKKTEITDRSTILEKSGAYAFTNKVEVTLKSADYKNDSDTAVNGTVEPSRMLLSVEESSIKLSMGDVKYTYNESSFLKGENKPTINQEYVFNIKPGATLNIEAKEKLFIISNDFNPNTRADWGLNIVGPIIKSALEPVLKGLADSKRGFKQTHFIRLPTKDKSSTSETRNNQVVPQNSRSRNISLLSNNLDNSNAGLIPQINDQSVQDIYQDPDNNQELSRLSYRERKIEDEKKVFVKIKKKRKKKTPNENSDDWEGIGMELQPQGTTEFLYVNLIIKKIDFLIGNCTIITNRFNAYEEWYKQQHKKKDIRVPERDFQQDKNILKKYEDYLNALSNTIDTTGIRNNSDFTQKYQELIKEQRLLNSNWYDDIKNGDARAQTNNFYLFEKNNNLLNKIKGTKNKQIANKILEEVSKIKNRKGIIDGDDIISFYGIIETFNRLIEATNKATNLSTLSTLKFDWLEN